MGDQPKSRPKMDKAESREGKEWDTDLAMRERTPNETIDVSLPNVPHTTDSVAMKPRTSVIMQ